MTGLDSRAALRLPLPFANYHLDAPTRGIFKGEAESDLSVAVQVTPFEGPLPELPAPAFEPLPMVDDVEQMQQQQQQ